MKYKDSSLYQGLSKPQQRFLDDYISAKEHQRDIISAHKFFHATIEANHWEKDKMILTHIYTATQYDGEMSDPKPTRDPDAPKKERRKRDRVQKTAFKKNAYRRWKRKGWITLGTNANSGKEFVTLKGTKYEIVIEGKVVTLVSPGQTSLPLKAEKPTNERKTKQKQG